MNQGIDFVFYDLTRLWDGRGQAMASGVDRVDLRYALWFLARSERFCGLYQTSQGMRVRPAADVRSLLGDLSARWLGDVLDVEQSRLKLEAGVALEVAPQWRGEGEKLEGYRALAEKFRRVPLRQLLAERGLGATLLQVCSRGLRAHGEPGRDALPEDGVYVNIGQCLKFEASLGILPEGMRRLFFLHDVIPLTHPETQRATSRTHFRRFCQFVGQPGAQVIVSSQVTMAAIRGLPVAERSLFDAVRDWQVCPLAVEARFLRGAKEEGSDGDVPVFRSKSFRLRFISYAGQDGGSPLHFESERVDLPYFLAVGTVEPRKNFGLLLTVWEGLLSDGGSVPKLIWAGKSGWSADRAWIRRLRKLEAAGVAEWRTGVSDAALQQLMSGARALLFPSVVEGWGLPLSEALAMGLPVLASDIPVFREVGQGVPEHLPPRDSDSWASAITEYAATDSARRAAQLQRLRNYRPTSWEDHFLKLKLEV